MPLIEINWLLPKWTIVYKAEALQEEENEGFTPELLSCKVYFLIYAVLPT